MGSHWRWALGFGRWAALVVVLQPTLAAQRSPTSDVDAIYPDVETLYKDLHRNPELAFQETQTAAKLAARLKALGFEVTTGVGKTGHRRDHEERCRADRHAAHRAGCASGRGKDGASVCQQVTAKNARASSCR